MNYRHAFHAGGPADVLKHAVLARILRYLGEKPAAFRVLDTHAGSGVYDLRGPEAQRSSEAQQEIVRLASATLADDAGPLLAPYRDAVRALNGGDVLDLYPGSPALVRAFLRPHDRLVACELEPGAHAALTQAFDGDRRIKTLAIDGWTALNAYVPPPERRGLVLIDPPFEQAEDFERLAEGLTNAHRKWATGIFVGWYPIKDRAAPDALARRLRRAAIPKVLQVELGFPASPGRLAGSGLIVINPPWTMADELGAMLPALAAVFGSEPQTARVGWLTAER